MCLTKKLFLRSVYLQLVNENLNILKNCNHNFSRQLLLRLFVNLRGGNIILFKLFNNFVLFQHEEPDSGVSCWASSFEKLLEDPDGLQTFAVSLKFFSLSNVVSCFSDFLSS